MTISIQVPKLPIETPEDHKAVLARIDALMDAEAGSDEAVELAVLGMLCAQYEREAFPIDPPSPIDAIRFRMEQYQCSRHSFLLLFAILRMKVKALALLRQALFGKRHGFE